MFNDHAYFSGNYRERPRLVTAPRFYSNHDASRVFAAELARLGFSGETAFQADSAFCERYGILGM